MRIPQGYLLCHAPFWSGLKVPLELGLGSNVLPRGIQLWSAHTAAGAELGRGYHWETKEDLFPPLGVVYHGRAGMPMSIRRHFLGLKNR